MSAPAPHPHFDDGGTLDWHRGWASARAAARAGGKTLFVEIGRELCGQCRTLVQSVVPHPRIAPLLREHFVALAADADEPEDEVMRLVLKLDDPVMLPFVIFADAEGRFLTGSSGSVDPAELLQTLTRLVGEGAA